MHDIIKRKETKKIIEIFHSNNLQKNLCPEWDSNPRSPPCKGGILTN